MKNYIRAKNPAQYKGTGKVFPFFKTAINYYIFSPCLQEHHYIYGGSAKRTPIRIYERINVVSSRMEIGIIFSFCSTTLQNRPSWATHLFEPSKKTYVELWKYPLPSLLSSPPFTFINRKAIPLNTVFYHYLHSPSLSL